jgi:2-polyprenyl-6-methoxyphenol hydroxylase-like FAD-dependent oxidoreductase
VESLDVLIVGAGPSGLTFAIECLRYGLKVRIIEKNGSLSPYSKACALQARTLETFQRMGIHKDFLAEGKKIRASNFYCNKKKLAHVPFDQIPSPFPFVLSICQNTTEEILIHHLKKLGCTVERSTTLESFEEKDSLIYAHTQNETITTKYLIGCDGAHSVIRKSLGFSFQGKLFSDIFSLADVEIGWDLSQKEFHLFLENNGLMAALPLPEENRYRLIFPLKRLRNYIPKSFNVEEGVIGSEDRMLPNIGEIESILTNYLRKPISVSNPKWIANFHINSRLSNKYSKGNIFLIGDAAHIHSPVGGQGMNTGIQDAFNLAWKIAFSEKNPAIKKSLLKTYEKERRELGKKLLKATEEASEFVTTRSTVLIFLRPYLISFLFRFKKIQKFLVKLISEVNIKCGDRRMENVMLNIDGTDVTFFSATEGSTKFHLILFAVEQDFEKHPQLEIFKAKNSTVKKAVLVRPDGYVAIEDFPPFHKLKHYPFLKIHSKTF